MSAKVECHVCRCELSLGLAIASEPWPVSIWCPHCESRYALKAASSWRWFWGVVPIAAGLCAVGASSGLAALGGKLHAVMAVIGGVVGFVSVVWVSMWLQRALVQRLYRRGEFDLWNRDVVVRAEPEPPRLSCGTCDRSMLIAEARCPMCGAVLATTAINPIVCSSCGEHLRIADVCCPACRSPVGSRVQV